MACQAGGFQQADDVFISGFNADLGQNDLGVFLNSII